MIRDVHLKCSGDDGCKCRDPLGQRRAAIGCDFGSGVCPPMGSILGIDEQGHTRLTDPSWRSDRSQTHHDGDSPPPGFGIDAKKNFGLN